jgi:hypothetical protein
MKKLISLAVVMLIVAIPLNGVWAGTGGPYTVGVQIANLSSTAAANIVMSFYDQAGALQANPSDTIAAAGSKTYFPLNVASGFNGSMVISSDQPVAAIANVVLNNGTGSGAAYSSFSSGATTINLPNLNKNNYGLDTWFNVQNVGSADATVYVSYAPGTCTESPITVKPNSSKTVDQSVNSCLPNGFVGAATVTSTQSIVATAMQIQRSGNQVIAYRGFTSASTTLVMPQISSNFYKSGTGIQIQNTGATATNVTLTYTPSAGFPGASCTETKAIPAGASTTFGFPQLPAGCGTTGTGVSDTTNGGFVGAAKVTANSANMPLVAIVNQITRGAASGDAYQAINPANATSKVSLPNINDRNYGLFTGLAVANVGTQPTSISCTFSGTSYTASAANVQPGSALTDVQLNKIANKYVGSALCAATGGDAKIAGIAQQTMSGAAAASDLLYVYDGFNY